MPKVSVIIPTYNRARFVLKAIQSVLDQTFNDFEIIVVDDGSTDNTRNLLTNFGKKIRYFYKNNAGVASARNFGIQQSCAKYIAFLDSDDMWLPERLGKGVKILDSNKDTSLVFSDIYRVKNGQRMKQSYFDLYSPYKGFVFENLYLQDFIPTSSVVLKEECFKKTGLFDEDLPSCEDYDMWLRISTSFRVKYINEPLVLFMYHSKNLSSDIVKGLQQQKKVLEKVNNLYPLLVNNFKHKANKKMALVAYLICRYLVKEKRYDEAIKEIKKSMKLNIFNWKIYLLLIFSFVMEHRSFKKRIGIIM